MPDLEDLKPRALAAAFLVAGSLILFQVSFSRLVSYKLFYHFVFLAISLSLLGLGAAGTYVAVTSRPRDLDRSLHRWLACLAISVPIAFLLIANPVGVTQHPPIRTKLLGPDAITYLLWCAPLMIWLNFCGGVVLTSLFSRYSHRMGKLYSADLLGAGAASLGCVGMMKYGSPPAAFVSAVIGITLALLPFHLVLPRGDRQRWLGAVAVTVALGLSAAVFLGPPWLRNFENFRTIGRAHRKVIKYEWNHLIRTDHVFGWYVLDGEAATRIVAWTEKAKNTPSTKPAYEVAPAKPAVGIIGVGGGRQLADALRADASHVLAIDINPTIIEWVLNEDRALTHDLFFDPRVETVVGEGRHAIRSAGRSFDVLVMHAIDTYAAAASGAYALTENFLYTKEAFKDYYHALSDDGVLTVSRWLFNPPRENLRLFSTALTALEELGVADPRDHLVVLAPVGQYEKLGDRRIWGYLLMTKRPFTAEALANLRAHFRGKPWSFLYTPDVRTDTPFDELAHAADRREFQRDYPYLVSTVTDSSPYLFQFYNPLHWTAYRQVKDWATVQIYQWSAIMLLVTLAVSILLSFLLIIAPLLWAKRSRPAGSSGEAPAIRFRHGLYFAGLGIGFMALEVPIIQILSLYLGHPTYGFSVVLVSLLVATGLGSLAVERLRVAPWAVCATVAVLLAVVMLTVFPLVHGTLDLPDPARFAIALLIVGVCGLPMGMPLALGVRELGRHDSRSVAWAWGINGAASVVGACLVMIAMVFAGSYTALSIGVLCYATSAVAGRVWS